MLWKKAENESLKHAWDREQRRTCCLSFFLNDAASLLDMLEGRIFAMKVKGRQ